MKANLEPDDQNPGSKKIVVEVFKVNAQSFDFLCEWLSSIRSRWTMRR